MDMRKRRVGTRAMSLAAVIGMLGCMVCSGLDINDEPADEEYFYGGGIQIPNREHEKVFLPEDKRANFTFFHGVEDVAVRGGRLTFTLSADKATLGWGNYLGKQPLGEMVDMWQQQNVVRLRVKQSIEESKWTVREWRDGAFARNASSYATGEAVLKGKDWQEIEYGELRNVGNNIDGLEFEIEGEKGARIEVEWLKLVQVRGEGWLRKEFTIPEGKIWRAIADVGSMNDRHWYGRSQRSARLYINGKVVERTGASHLYHTAPVDIASYLKPGKNCIGFYGFRIAASYSTIYLQARITMQSGEVITVTGDDDWTLSHTEEAGWHTAGFDDSSWIPAKQGGSVWDTRGSSQQVNIPAYSGRLVMRNPGRKDLFYTDTDNVVVDVHVPAGLKQRGPELTWLFGRADAKGVCRLDAEGLVSTFDEKEGSLVFRIHLGKQEHGVYGLALSLVGSDGETIEERTREPLVVLRKVALKPVAGLNYDEGLDLELEDEIDFTDPKDPHPWVEAEMPPSRSTPAPKVEEPNVVRKGGLVYREVVGHRRGSGFRYRVEFKHPGSFYYMELEYPDNAQRIIEVLVSSAKAEGVHSPSEAGVGAETGGKFHLTGEMQTLRWLHVADPGPHSFDVLNVVDGQKAAAKSVKIYRVKGDLPSIEAGAGRLYGVHNEGCKYYSGIGMTFGVGYMMLTMKADDKAGLPRMQRYIKDLVWNQETSERYVQYLKFTGQNCHVPGMFQYTEANVPFLPAPIRNDSRVSHCARAMRVNYFDVNGIDFYAGVEFSQFRNIRTYANDAQAAKGADTIYMVDAEGRQHWGYGTVVQNWLHPEIRRRHNKLMRQLRETYGHLQHFRGVHYAIGPTQLQTYWPPAYGWRADFDDPLHFSYDDLTFSLFEQDTGVKIPISKTDPERFQKRAVLIRDPGLRRRFIAWRGKKFRDFLAEAVGTLRQGREDLRFLNLLFYGAVDRLHKHLKDTNTPFKEWMRQFAIDFDQFNSIEGLSVGRKTISWQIGYQPHQSQNPYCWVPRTDPDVISAFEGQSPRFVQVRTSWDENYLMSPGGSSKVQNKLMEGSDWAVLASRTRALPQPGGYHCREAFTQAMITGDPEILIGGFTDININMGHEQMLRSITKPFTCLPEEKFSKVLETGLETNLAIRQLNKRGVSYFYVANPGYWHVKGTISVFTDGEIQDLSTAKLVARGRTDLSIELTPYGVAAFRVNSGTLTITGYSTEPMAARELAHMIGIITRVRKLMADDFVKLVVLPEDRVFMHGILDRADAALGRREYALAWSVLKHYRFWSLWKTYLEKAAAGLARLPPSVEKEEGTGDPEALPTLVARRTTSPVVVDGVLDEEAWSTVPFSAEFWVKDGKPAFAETGVKALYDDKGLHLAFACAERNPEAVKAEATEERQLFLAKDDALAVLVQPDENMPLHYQMAFNAKGAHFDQRVKGGRKEYEQFRPEWQSAAKMGKDLWTAEVTLPYAAFGLTGVQRAWRANFFRVARNHMVDICFWSSVQGSAHDTSRFGTIRFE